MRKNRNFQDGCEKHHSKHEAAIDENGWNHRCKGNKNRNKGATAVNIKLINLVFKMIIFIVNLQLFYIHCQDFDDLVERMAPAAMAAVNPAQSKTESNQEQACW